MATDPALLTVRMISPEKVVFEGTAKYLMVPSADGTLGILPSHTPMFAEIVAGDLYIASDPERIVAIEKGILKVESDTVTILIGL